jgi:predicted nucleotidyltransferase
MQKRMGLMGSQFDQKKLKALCRKYHLKLVVLHGSRATGNARKISDIDVGILAQERIDQEAYAGILSDFCGLFGDRFDPVFLNGAEPLISYRVALDGKPLYEAAPGTFEEFRVQSVLRYMDSKKFRDLEKSYIKRAMATE